jgi:hypothetical protein
MTPSARVRINQALRGAGLAVTCIGHNGHNGHRIREVIESVIEKAYDDGEREARGLKDHEE